MGHAASGIDRVIVIGGTNALKLNLYVLNFKDLTCIAVQYSFGIPHGFFGHHFLPTERLSQQQFSRRKGKLTPKGKVKEQKRKERSKEQINPTGQANMPLRALFQVDKHLALHQLNLIDLKVWDLLPATFFFSPIGVWVLGGVANLNNPRREKGWQENHEEGKENYSNLGTPTEPTSKRGAFFNVLPVAGFAASSESFSKRGIVRQCIIVEGNRSKTGLLMAKLYRKKIRVNCLFAIRISGFFDNSRNSKGYGKKETKEGRGAGASSTD